MIQKMRKRRKGFTLIEMLIVITIIALLASLILVGMGSARAKARDARRIADLHNVANTLELYYSSTGSYPQATSWSGLVTILTEAQLISKLPQDPSANGSYQYCSSDPTTYLLAAQLEENDPSLKDSATGSCQSITCGVSTKGYCVSPQL